MADFFVTQRGLKRKSQIRNMVDNWNNSLQDHPIRIAIFEDKKIIIDGHHRAVALCLAGKNVLEYAEVEYVYVFNKTVCGTLEDLIKRELK